MKKKTVFLLACLLLSSLTANAQFGDVLRKAAQKAAQKTTEKLTDKAAEKAADAIEKELDKSKAQNAPAENNAEAEQATYASIMAQMPDLPTVQQLVNYKEAELNEQSLKLMVSPVTSFQTKLLGLSVQAVSLTTSSADSAQIVDAAYKNAQLATGLTREELDELAALPNRSVKFLATLNSLHKLFVSFLRQTSFHNCFVKNVFAKNWCNFIHYKSPCIGGSRRYASGATSALC